MIDFFSFLEPLTQPLRGRSLLFVTSDGEAAEARFALDPDLSHWLKTHGVGVNQTTYREISIQLLDGYHSLVLGGFPKTDDPDMVDFVLKRTMPVVLEAVGKGLGVLLMVDDHYSRLFEPLNRALSPLGLEVLCEDVWEPDPDRRGVMPSSPEIATLRVDPAIGSPVSIPAGGVVLPCGWQSGVWPLLADDSSWTPILRGSPESESKVLRKSEPGRGGAAPLLAAARSWGKGRLAVLPCHSTFFFGNGLHARWGRGWFFQTADNAQFIASLLGWLTEPRGERPMAKAIPRSALGSMPWFHPVPLVEQPTRLEPLKGLVAIDPGSENLSTRVAELADEARLNGFDWAVFAPREEVLDSKGWEKLVAACRLASSEEFAALPSVDFCASKDFGARGLAVLPRFWPPRSANRRFVIQMIEEGGGWQIFSSPWNSPQPAWNIGGFQGIEISGHDGVDQKLVGRGEEIFLNLQAHDWFLSPVTRFHATNAGEIQAAASVDEATWVLAVNAADVASRIPRIESCEFSEVFVSGGPLLREFWMEGPGVTRDVWEGRYYTWSDDSAEEMALHIAVESVAPLREVVLWESGSVLARFAPQGTKFRTRFVKPNDRSARNYWVTATDTEGGRLIGMARRTKSGTFRAHGGGDRMNTYGSVVVPTPRGEFDLRKRRCSTSATMLFGLGWRQHHLNIYPPVPAVDYTPEGGEWGAPSGRLERVYLNPELRTVQGISGERVLEDRLGIIHTGDEGAELRETIDRHEVVSAGPHTTAQKMHLEKFSPEASGIEEIADFRATGRYVFGRWNPEGGPLVFRFEREIVFKRDVDPVAPFRVLRLQADSDTLLKSFLLRPRFQAGEVVPTECAAPWREVLTGGLAGVFPQPWGSFGFAHLSGAKLVARVVRGDGVAALEAALPVPDGGRFKKGESVCVAMLVLVGGKAGEGVEFFNQVGEALVDDPQRGCAMLQGVCEGGNYPVRLHASNHATKWILPETSKNLPFFAEISGFQTGDAVWACEEERNEWRPLAVFEDKAFFTVPAHWRAIVAGAPFVAAAEGLYVFLSKFSSGWRLRVHNPRAEEIRSTLRSNPAFARLRPWRANCAVPAGGDEVFEISHTE